MVILRSEYHRKRVLRHKTLGERLGVSPLWHLCANRKLKRP